MAGHYSAKTFWDSAFPDIKEPKKTACEFLTSWRQSGFLDGSHSSQKDFYLCMGLCLLVDEEKLKGLSLCPPKSFIDLTLSKQTREAAACIREQRADLEATKNACCQLESDNSKLSELESYLGPKTRNKLKKTLQKMDQLKLSTCKSRKDAKKVMTSLQEVHAFFINELDFPRLRDAESPLDWLGGRISAQIKGFHYFSLCKSLRKKLGKPGGLKDNCSEFEQVLNVCARGYDELEKSLPPSTVIEPQRDSHRADSEVKLKPVSPKNSCRTNSDNTTVCQPLTPVETWESPVTKIVPGEVETELEDIKRQYELKETTHRKQIAKLEGDRTRDLTQTLKLTATERNTFEEKLLKLKSQQTITKEKPAKEKTDQLLAEVAELKSRIDVLEQQKDIWQKRKEGEDETNTRAIAKLHKENDELQQKLAEKAAEANKLKNKVYEDAQRRLSENPQVEQLSDSNRPSEVARRYGDLFQRTYDVAEALADNDVADALADNDVEDDECNEFNVSVLQVCRDVTKTKLTQYERESADRHGINMEFLRGNKTAARIVKESVFSLLRLSSASNKDRDSQDVAKTALKKIEEKYGVNSKYCTKETAPVIEKFVTSSSKVIWEISLLSQPADLVTEDKTFDPSMHERFIGSDQRSTKIKSVVWPRLAEKFTRTTLAKGRVLTGD
eukprot:m.54422 g.54422  ORF g.54422 m.54422 type:complete len:671 (+) comp34366_c0_seq3:118-2130(+)